MPERTPTETVGQRLRLLRSRAMYSQSDFARLSGISRSTIVNIESGRSEPQAYTLRVLAEALSLDPQATHWLVTGEGALEPLPDLGVSTSVFETPFIGRKDDLEIILDSLANPECRILTLTGPGGVGKTRLALEAARRRTIANDATVEVVLLANLDNPADVLPAIADALHIPSSGGAVREALAAALSGAPRLLVLDNLEHLLPAVPDLGWLLRNVPGLQILATSREALRLHGERVVVVHPLATDGPASPAVELFTRLASQSSAAFSGESAVEAVQELCARLGGFPLAIELAAAQMDVFNPAELLDLMGSSGLGALARAPIDDIRRFPTMDAAIAWSVNRLSPDDWRLLRTLAVFPDGFGVDAAAAVLCAAFPGAAAIPGETGVALTRLARAHLIQPHRRLGSRPGARFMVLEPIRIYALGHLRANGEEIAVRRAHAEYTAARFGESSDRVLRNRTEAMEHLAEEYPDGRAALDWALDAGDAEIASRLVSSLKYAHMFRFRAVGVAAQFDRLVPRAATFTPDARLWVHYERAELASREGDLSSLRAVLTAALDDARAAGDPMIEAMALLYWSCDLDEDPETALATIDRARAVLGPERDAERPRFLQAWSLIRRGVELHRLGRLEEARDALEAGIARKNQEGNSVGNGPPLAHLARVQRDLGHQRQAASSLLAALALSATLSDDWLAFHAARWLADLARSGGPEAQAIARTLDVALAAHNAEQAFQIGPEDMPPAPEPTQEPVLPLPEAIAIARRLPDLLPERIDAAPGARFTGTRLE